MTDAPQDPQSGTDNGTPNAAENTAENSQTTEHPAPTEAAPAYSPPAYAASASATPAGATPDGGAPASATQPLNRDYASAPVTTTEPRRSNRVTIIAALAVGALVGGVSGAGVAAFAVSANQGNNASSTISRPTAQNITVNDPSNVNNITAVAAKAAPSVVTISVSGKSEAGTGSGIILSKDGYIVTNTHVVTLDGASANTAVQVTTSDGHLFAATVVGTDPIVDLAVIKVKDPTGLVPAEFADSSKLNVGETAVAIGAPLGLNNTVTDGIVSALNRSISIASSAVPKSGGDTSTPNSASPFDFWQFNNGQGDSQSQPAPAAAKISLPVIQTDAAINPGNSGGALLNSDAKVIGINVAIASAGQSSGSGQSGSIGVGFAIPSNLAQRVASEIIKNGSATHGLLGAGVLDVSPTSNSTVVGATIKEVTSGGAADKAGLKPGDIVTQFNGTPITNSTDLTAQVRFLAAGASTSLTYMRNGSSKTVDVTLGSLKL